MIKKPSPPLSLGHNGLACGVLTLDETLSQELELALLQTLKQGHFLQKADSFF